MRQILQSYRTGELWLADCPAPACPANGVLVRTRASVVSAGTERMLLSLARKSLVGKAMARPDLVRQVLKRISVEGLRPTLEKVFAKLDEPVPLGYSAMGTVLEAGRAAGGFQPGERVALAGAGYACHAEANVVPRTLCARVPDAVSDEDAAFATVGAIALQGVRQTDPKLAERIVVIGLGLLGLLTVQMCKANGCAVLGVDPDPARRALATTLGADQVTGDQVEAVAAAFTGGVGADAVIITAATASNGPIETAGAVARQKGRVVVVGLVGMDVPRDVFYRKELDLRLSMSYGPGRYDPAYEEAGHDYPLAYVRFTEQRNLDSFLYLVAQKVVTPSALITHRFAFADALDAYLLLEGKLPADHPQAKPSLGIVLTYPEDAVLERGVLRRPAGVVAATPGTLAVGCLGVGGFAKGVLLPRLAKMPEVALVAMGASRGTSASAAAQRFRASLATTDADELIAHSQAVVIATPHGSHAGLACRALRAGRHVFVEKPLCLQEEDLAAYADALATAEAAGAKPCLMVGFNRRFSPHIAALRAAMAGKGPLVVVYRVNAGRIPPTHWIQDPERGGGRILGEVCHFVDTCGHLIGAVPREVHAASIASPRADVVAQDSVAITIRYADGSLATIHYLGEGHADLGKERVEVHGGGVSAVCDDYVRTRVHGARGGLKGAQAKGFDQELAAFVTACRQGGTWPIPWAELVATQRVCWAALRSLETGQTVPVES